MLITWFTSLHAAAGQAVSVEWDALCAYLAAPPEHASKAACPLLKLATFGDVPSPKGILRHDANVTSVWGVEGDHDDETVSPAQAAQMLQWAGVQALVYTSPSHTPSKPRWRVLAPTSQALLPNSRRELAGRINAAVGGCLRPESFALSQAFYFGRVAGVAYETHVTAGQPVDLCGHLAPVFPTFEAAPRDDTQADGPVPEWRGPTDDADLLRRALQSRSAASAFGNRASFADLWEGNVEALARAFPGDKDSPYNASDADAALMAHLAFWTGKDVARIERLMRQSALARPKWDRADYLPRTFERILSAPGQVLQDKELLQVSNSPPAPSDAIKPSPFSGATMLTPTQQIELFKGCVYIESHGKILVPGGQLLKPDVFNARYGGHSFIMDNANERTVRKAFEAFTESQAFRRPIARSICFKPNLPPATILTKGGVTRANKYWPADVRDVEGDASPWTDHVLKMLPFGEDYEIIIAYMAALVQYPGIKFGWCPVVQGAEGNGKSTLSRCIAEAVGQHYTEWPHAEDLASEFNGWLLDKLFIAVEELYCPEHQKSIDERLKTLITADSGIQIQFKGVDQESVEICANFMITTNHKGAVRKTADNGRRFAVFYTAQQSKKDFERDGMTGNYFPDLYKWLRADGFAIVTNFLRNYKIPDRLNPATTLTRAPDTSSTSAVIAQSLGPVEQEIVEAVAQGAQGFVGGWISTTMLEQMLRDKRMGGRISHFKRTALLEGMGYIRHPGLADGRTNNPVRPDGMKAQLWVLPNTPQAAIVGAAEIAKAYENAQASAAAGVVFRA